MALEGIDSPESERPISRLGIAAPRHYRRLEERPFTADERSTTTILFGNLTPKHEVLAKAAFERVGFRVQNLPAPTKQMWTL